MRQSVTWFGTYCCIKLTVTREESIGLGEIMQMKCNIAPLFVFCAPLLCSNATITNQLLRLDENWCMKSGKTRVIVSQAQFSNYQTLPKSNKSRSMTDRQSALMTIKSGNKLFSPISFYMKIPINYNVETWIHHASSIKITLNEVLTGCNNGKHSSRIQH